MGMHMLRVNNTRRALEKNSHTVVVHRNIHHQRFIFIKEELANKLTERKGNFKRTIKEKELKLPSTFLFPLQFYRA
jgi:hypothetical protein